MEMAPPDVAGALAANAIDAFSMGEPYPSQAEMGGFGHVLFHAREYWPDYMSCVVVVRQDVIDTRPQAVQVLVDGIARSGFGSRRVKPTANTPPNSWAATISISRRRCCAGPSPSRWTE